MCFELEVYGNFSSGFGFYWRVGVFFDVGLEFDWMMFLVIYELKWGDYYVVILS